MKTRPPIYTKYYERVFLRLSHDRGLLSAEQLRFAVGGLDEIGRMWHGWAGKK